MSTGSKPTTDPPLRFVYCERPRCPECGETKLRSYRSIEQGDGSRMKWTECKSCGEKFHLILE